jgi:uncharacterized protein YdeI (YjbR/CyaY-like superfamily)
MSASAPEEPLLEFADRGAWETWLEDNHQSIAALWLKLAKKGAPQQTVTQAQALEVALCFGWIDGQVRSLDGARYANRYTPRRPGGRWSAVNLRQIPRLRSEGRLAPAGLRAFEARDPGRAGYSFEERPRRLAPALARRFRSAGPAWERFRRMPAGYRRTATFWVMSAVKAATRERRLDRLVEASRAGRRVDLLDPNRSAGPTPPRSGSGTTARAGDRRRGKRPAGRSPAGSAPVRRKPRSVSSGAR